MNFKKIIISLFVLVTVVSLSAFAEGLVKTGTTRTHKLTSSYSYPDYWQTASGGEGLGSIRYAYNKGGAFSADSISMSISTSTVKKSAFSWILDNDNTKHSKNMKNVKSGSFKLKSTLWVKTKECSSRFVENKYNGKIYYKGK